MCISDIKSPLVAFLCLTLRVAKWLMPPDTRVEVRISTIRRAKASSALGLSLSANGASVRLSLTRGSGLKRSLSTVRRSRTGEEGSTSTATIPEGTSLPRTAVSSSVAMFETPLPPSEDGRGLAI